MSAQTTYSAGLKNGYSGQLADIGYNDVDTVTNKAAAADVKPGIAVKLDATSGKDQTVAIGIAAGLFNGIAVRDLANEQVAGEIVYPAKKTFPVLKSGKMYLAIPAGGNAGALLKANGATGVIDVGAAGVGEFQLDAVLEEVTTAGEVGRIHLRSLAVVAGS